MVMEAIGKQQGQERRGSGRALLIQSSVNELLVLFSST